MVKILRALSYGIHFLLGLLLFGLGAVSIISDTPLRLEMLPWSGMELSRWLIYLGLAAVVCVTLAVLGIFRFLFPVWCLVTLILTVRGYFFSPYRFSGDDEFYWVLGFTSLLLLTFAASLTLFKAARAHPANELQRKRH
jgi:hypothetical protein